MSQQDEILIEYNQSLKAQNADLREEIETLRRILNKKSKPKSILGLEDIWATFWNTLGGIWKDFWTSISSMWEVFWKGEAGPILFGVLGFTMIVCTAIVGYHVWVPDKIPGKPTGEFGLRANHHNKCYYVYERLADGEISDLTQCIKERSEAVKILDEHRESAK